MCTRHFVLLCVVCALACAGSAYGSSRSIFIDQGDYARKSSAEEVAAKPTCDQCVNVVDEIDKSMEDPAKQAKIGALISVEVCAKLPENMRAKCLLYAPVLIPAVISAIEKDLPPRKLCALVELCPPTNDSAALTTDSRSRPDSTMTDAPPSLAREATLEPSSLAQGATQAPVRMPALHKLLLTLAGREDLFEVPKDTSTGGDVIGESEDVSGEADLAAKAGMGRGSPLKEGIDISEEMDMDSPASLEQAPFLRKLGLAPLLHDVHAKVAAKFNGATATSARAVRASAAATASIMDQIAAATTIMGHRVRQVVDPVGEVVDDNSFSVDEDGDGEEQDGDGEQQAANAGGVRATTPAAVKGTARDVDACSLCTAAAESLRRTIENAGGADAVVDDGLRACDALPGPISDGCTSLVTTYLAQAVEMLTSMSPHECCTAVEACRGDEFESLTDDGRDGDDDFSSGSGAATDQSPGLGVETDEEGSGEEGGNLNDDISEDVEVIAVASAVAGGGAVVSALGVRSEDCDVCKLVVQSVEEKLADPDTQDKFFAILKSKCGTVPQYADQCVQLVDTYGPVILAQLVQTLQPDVFCADAGICKPTPMLVDAS